MPFSARIFLVLGALNLAVAIALGAAGTHALKSHLATSDPVGWFGTAIEYHRFHAMGLLVVGLATERWPGNRGFVLAGWLLFAGIIFFCGNLYLRSLAGIHQLHALTPVGGASFILGWLAFSWGALKPRGARGSISSR